ASYLKHSERRIEEEKLRCGGGGGLSSSDGYLSIATRKGAVAIVERTLVEHRVQILLQRGEISSLSNCCVAT
ncbi:hypothetical protein BC830DRAFT_1145046, partial [Chytriomyces sp. MP71]